MRWLLLLAVLCGPGWAGAQERCLTPPGISPWLQEFQQHPERFPQLRSQTGWNVPVTVYITRSDNGQPAIEVARMLDAFCRLNRDFAPTSIQFYLGAIRFLDRPDYYDHYSIETAVGMMTSNRVAGTVNVFFVRTAVEEGVCGYNLVERGQASFGMTLTGDCTSSSNSNWAHEMGHYFSLPHTFNGWEGIQHDYREPAPEQVNNVLVERIDQRNCQKSGDGFCDTPPDYLNGRWYCAEDGNSSFVQRDPENHAFRSDGSLIMSYAFDGCADRFSTRQISAMQNYLVSQRSDHLPIPPDFVEFRTFDIQLTQPENQARLDYRDSIPLQWEPVAGADGYLVEISFLPTFALLERQEYLTGHRYLAGGLRSDRTYYWRVRPFSGKYTCTVYSPTYSFSVRDFATSIRDIPQLSDIQLLPNPVAQGKALQVKLVSTGYLPVRGAIRSADGRQLWQAERSLLAGVQYWSLPTESLSRGVYFLQVWFVSGMLTQKFVVQ